MNKATFIPLINKISPTIFELGAHHGEDSAHFRHMWPNADIHMFEPDPRNVQIIKSARIPANLFEGVVSDVDGWVTFHRSGVNDITCDGSGSILAPKKHLEYFPAVKFDGDVTVPSTTLDAYVAKRQINMIDLIWADVQGAEERIIKGGLNTFQSKVRYFFTEYCQEELYEGCPKKERILELLECFEVLSDVGSEVCGDMLLRNKRL